MNLHQTSSVALPNKMIFSDCVFCSAQDRIELLAGEGAKGQWALTPSPNPLKGGTLGRKVGVAARLSGLIKGLERGRGGGQEAAAPRPSPT